MPVIKSNSSGDCRQQMRGAAPNKSWWFLSKRSEGRSSAALINLAWVWLHVVSILGTGTASGSGGGAGGVQECPPAVPNACSHLAVPLGCCSPLPSHRVLRGPTDSCLLGITAVLQIPTQPALPEHPLFGGTGTEPQLTQESTLQCPEVMLKSLS